MASSPYFFSTAARALACPASSLTTTAVPVKVGVPSSTRPRTSQARTSTRESRASRLVLPTLSLLMKTNRSPSGANHTGVDTGVPSLRNVVKETYLALASEAWVTGTG